MEIYIGKAEETSGKVFMPFFPQIFGNFFQYGYVRCVNIICAYIICADIRCVNIRHILAPDICGLQMWKGYNRIKQ